MITKANIIDGISISTANVWRVVGDAEPILGNNSDTRAVTDIAEIPADTFTEGATLEDARNVLKDKMLASELTVAEIDMIASAYPPWQPGIDVTAGKMLSHNQKLYQVTQSHRTQPGWTPSITPARFTTAYPDNIIPEWVQPPAEKPYMKGNKVLFKGPFYEAAVDNNVSQPGADKSWKKL